MLHCTIYRIESRRWPPIRTIDEPEEKRSSSERDKSTRRNVDKGRKPAKAAEGIYRSVERKRKKERKKEKQNRGNCEWEGEEKLAVGRCESGPPTEDREVPRRATAMHSRLRRYTSNHNVTNASRPPCR